MHVHTLDGCAPAPLAHYLKALGVLRLVAEQADPQARGWWDGDRFRLATKLDADQLADFFLTRYMPTPLVSPWNKGSGFFQSKDPGLAPIETATAARLEPFKQGITASRALADQLATADAQVRTIKAESKRKDLTKRERDALRQSDAYKKRLAEAERQFKSLKDELIPRARIHWRGLHSRWLDAALVIDDTGKARFPALLGTGGNDGRLDFTNNFMQRLSDVFDLAADAIPRPGAAAWVDAALWGNPVAGCLGDRAVGQFLPGGAGGANSVNGPEGTSLLNPFDFILMLEGSLLFTANAVKRLDSRGPQRAAAPFVVAAQAAGYASAGAADESARGEQWMPLWNQPVTLTEVRRLFAEGRAQIGATVASQPLDMARAAARLGTARGIASFHRFGYIERNGQSNLAVPLGHFVVSTRASPHIDCLDDVSQWLTRLRRHAADKDSTARLSMATRQASDSAFDAAQHPTEPARWQQLLAAMTRVEAIMRTGSGFKAQPIPPLRPEWVEAADDGTAEFRLALAFALQARGFQKGYGHSVDDIRRHWLPLDRKRHHRFATTGDTMNPRLETRPDVVMNGRNGIDDAIALLERRQVEATREGLRRFPLQPAPRAAATAADLSAWLLGQVDPDRTLGLARAMMALDRNLWAEQIVAIRPPPPGSPMPDDAWMCIRLAHLAWPLPDGRDQPCDPAILRRLSSGDAGTALDLALRRLRAAGLRPAIRATTAPPDVARLWAAALAFPIHRETAAQFARRLDITFAQEQLT